MVYCAKILVRYRYMLGKPQRKKSAVQMEFCQIAFPPPPPQANGRIVGTIFRLFLDRLCTLEFLQDLKKCIECINKARTGPKQHILKHWLVPQKPLNTHQYNKGLLCARKAVELGINLGQYSNEGEGGTCPNPTKLKKVT